LGFVKSKHQNLCLNIEGEKEMKTKKVYLPLLILITALLLGACTSDARHATASITITDGMNRDVSINTPAQKIVSLAPSNTEILYAINAGDQIVGRDDLSDYPEDAKTIQSIGGSMGKLNLEAIVTLKPDLVLAAGIISPEQIKSLEDLNLTVYFLPNPKSLEELYQNIETVGKLTGHVEDATTVNASLKKRVVEIEKKISSSSQTRPKVFYELDSTEPNKPWTSGPGTFIDLLITKAGGENIGASLTDEWAQISLEEIVVQDPDIILLGDAAYGVTAESISQRAGWESLTAVKNNQIFAFDDDLVSRPGPRLVDGLETLARLLNPELY
jgi:iron complex transport system substrate-binding protein